MALIDNCRMVINVFVVDHRFLMRHFATFVCFFTLETVPSNIMHHAVCLQQPSFLLLKTEVWMLPIGTEFLFLLCSVIAHCFRAEFTHTWSYCM